VGEDHSSVVETYVNMARVLYSQGKIDDAMVLYEKAFEIKPRLYSRTFKLEEATELLEFPLLLEFRCCCSSFEGCKQKNNRSMELAFAVPQFQMFQ
jgi:tetratricopeptide (TPR) repeat protein